MSKSNPNRPHRAVIYVQAEVHELTKAGECAGDVVHRVEQFPIFVDGVDRNIAIRKLEELVQELKERCK